MRVLNLLVNVASSLCSSVKGVFAPKAENFYLTRKDDQEQEKISSIHPHDFIAKVAYWQRMSENPESGNSESK